MTWTLIKLLDQCVTSKCYHKGQNFVSENLIVKKIVKHSICVHKGNPLIV